MILSVEPVTSDIFLKEVAESMSNILSNFFPFFIFMIALTLIFPLFRMVNYLFLDGGFSSGSIEEVVKKQGVIDIYKRGFMFYFIDLKPVSKFRYYLHFLSDDYIKTDVATYKKFKQEYEFNTLEYKELIQEQICKPLMKIENDMYLLQFYESINYSLDTLSNLTNHIDVIDFEQEVLRVVQLVNNITTVIDSINNSANERVRKLQVESLQDVLKKHAALMDQFNQNVNIFHEVKKK